MLLIIIMSFTVIRTLRNLNRGLFSYRQREKRSRWLHHILRVVVITVLSHSATPPTMPVFATGRSAAYIRNKIKARGDHMYGEHVGRRCGRQFRRYLMRNFCIITTILIVLSVILLIPEFGIVKEKLILFTQKLSARLSSSTEYRDDNTTQDP